MKTKYTEMIGKCMRKAREEKRLTTQNMADMLHVDRSCIARWETGQRNISVESLIEYLNALDIDLYDFMNTVKDVDEGKLII